MTMNALFFADKTIHKLYLDNGKYNFGQSLPQIIYSIIITHAMEVILCYLTMTDIHIYEIKALDNKEQTTEKINDILNNYILCIFVFIIHFLLVLYFSFLRCLSTNSRIFYIKYIFELFI